jgi:Holliday junction resolvase
MGPEKNFENKIKDFLDKQGAWYVKFFANRMTKEGIPDILACVNGYFVGIEVKAQNGKPSDLQLYHCEKIRKSGGFAFVLYPSGFDDFKKIVEDLKHESFTRDMPLVLK